MPTAVMSDGDGSASTARTFMPSLAYILARSAAMVVFPTPPLPEMAIFNGISIPHEDDAVAEQVRLFQLDVLEDDALA